MHIRIKSCQSFNFIFGDLSKKPNSQIAKTIQYDHGFNPFGPSLNKKVTHNFLLKGYELSLYLNVLHIIP